MTPREVRARLRVTQAGAAALFGLHLDTYRRWEREPDRRAPASPLVGELVEALGRLGDDAVAAVADLTTSGQLGRARGLALAVRWDLADPDLVRALSARL